MGEAVVVDVQKHNRLILLAFSKRSDYGIWFVSPRGVTLLSFFQSDMACGDNDGQLHAIRL